MQELQSFSRTDEFRAFVDRVHQQIDPGENKFFLGFVVTRHPYWNSLKQIRAGGFDLLYPNYWPPPLGPYWVDSDMLRPPMYYTSDNNDDYLTSKWANFSEKQSFLVKVCFAPTEKASLGLRRRLEAVCQAERNFFAIVEDRAPARLASHEGGRQLVTGGQNGTIGGFLRDQNGRFHGLTCGHVARTKGDVVSADDASNVLKTLGKVGETNWPLNPIGGNTLCQPHPGNHDLDIAIVNVASGVVPQNTVRGIGQITDIYGLSQLGSGHQVRMSGAQSGAEDYTITGYVVTYRTPYQGHYYCFSDVFEISGIPSTTWFQLFGQYIPTPSLGDSGAWVTTDTATGNALCGMLYAVDNARGYVCFTDQIQSWTRHHGWDLSVF
ncbi:hypothetical protein [Rhizobium sp. NXC24]|uniref:hypothetical protein n=1 Tax=Rhizobium sp. NXC24 TaxID=2048897 RepID=UPI000CDF5288|nr:hypothetical protein [Rhizobium sp. NXC24]AVA21296.1 hypothetical protein NXC24_CH01645 [Rhizobium sp. NXC24]